MAIECKREGRRTYILGTPYGAREALKAAGAQARALAEQLAAELYPPKW